MMERNNESRGAWAWVFAWVLFIYCTIPLARTIQEYIRDHGGKVLFLYLTYAAFAAAAAVLARAVYRRRLSLSPMRALLLAVILGLFSWLTWTLRDNPEEALHFVQYGGLGLLLFRAVSRRHRDPSAYLVAAAAGSFFGILDEVIQWIVPRRFFDFRDMGINVLAVLLVQAALAFGIRPASVQGTMRASGLLRFWKWCAVNFTLLLLCLWNTPGVLEKLQGADNRLPWISQSMAEYGHRIRDPDIGWFKSRMSREQLAAADAERYEWVVPLINTTRYDREYYQLLDAYPAHRYPLLHEVRVHLFRRDRYLARSRNPDEASDRPRLAAVAHYENLIVERYFPRILANSVYAWSDEVKEETARAADLSGAYRSAVSRSLITVMPKGGFTLLLGTLIVLSSGLAIRYAQREKTLHEPTGDP